MGMRKLNILISVMAFLGMPFFVSAITINEIMYDLEGADSGREWVEIFNDSGAEINLTDWKFNDGSNHLLNEPPKNGGQGSLIIPAGGYAIFAGDAAVFLSEHSGYSGAVIDTVMSLNNSSSTLKLINNSASEVFSVFYTNTMGAAGDGNSLQYADGSWVASAPTPGTINAGVSEAPQQQQQSQTQPLSSGGNSTPYIPPEKLPHIKAYAGEDKTAMVGASVEFRGQGFGLKDEPLDNARYLWVFGDGASKEGKNITHIYQYSGEYIVSLNVSSGEYSASDYMLVKVIPNQVFISEIKTDPSTSLGANWIELENKSKEEIDISGCQIKYNTPPGGGASQTFIFPQSTRIRPNAFLVIPSSISGIILLQEKGIVEFLYSGGFKADIFSYNGFLQNGQSFNRANKISLIGQETPGAKNSVIIAQSAKSAEVVPPRGGTTSAKTPSDEIKEDNAQTANIITIGDDNSAKSNTKIYLIAVLGLIVFTGAAIFFIRRRGLTEI